LAKLIIVCSKIIITYEEKPIFFNQVPTFLIKIPPKFNSGAELMGINFYAEVASIFMKRIFVQLIMCSMLLIFNFWNSQLEARVISNFLTERHQLGDNLNLNWENSRKKNLQDFSLHTESEIFYLDYFLNHHLSNNAYCSDDFFKKNANYMYEVWNGLEISIIFSYLKYFYELEQTLPTGSTTCQNSYLKTIKLDELKSNWHREYYRAILNDQIEKSTKVERLSKNNLKFWIDLVLKSKTKSKQPAILELQLLEDLNRNPKMGQSSVLDIITEALESKCKQAQNYLVQLLKNENSSNHLINSPFFQSLVNKYNFYPNEISNPAMQACLLKEKKYLLSSSNQGNLFTIRDQVLHQLLLQNQREARGGEAGAYFSYGRRVYYIAKGIMPEKLKIDAVLKENEKNVLAQATVPKIVLNEENKTVINKELAPETKKSELNESLEIWISEFELKRKQLIEGKSEKVAIDMEKLDNDFEFSAEQIIENEKIYQKFNTQKVIKSMFENEDFGKKNAPLKLSHLKFLIDTENHQALYNIIHILGDHFYVINDFEKIKEPVLLEMINKAKKERSWFFNLIK